MKKRKMHFMALATIALLSALALSACGEPSSNQNEDSVQPHSTYQNEQQAKNVHDPSLIPSENGAKHYTTNRYGSTTNGMGTSVYSSIGSSGLYANGFSAHLESRLSALGVPDVRVFVFDDTVILAAEKLEPSAADYDSLQQRLLSQTEGMSGRGYSNLSGLGGFKGTDTDKHDNLSVARGKIKSLLGGDVRVLTVTGADAVAAIDQIRQNAMAETISPRKIARSIESLLELVQEGRK